MLTRGLTSSFFDLLERTKTPAIVAYAAGGVFKMFLSIEGNRQTIAIPPAPGGGFLFPPPRWRKKLKKWKGRTKQGQEAAQTVDLAPRVFPTLCGYVECLLAQLGLGMEMLSC